LLSDVIGRSSWYQNRGFLGQGIQSCVVKLPYWHIIPVRRKNPRWPPYIYKKNVSSLSGVLEWSSWCQNIGFSGQGIQFFIARSSYGRYLLQFVILEEYFQNGHGKYMTKTHIFAFRCPRMVMLVSKYMFFRSNICVFFISMAAILDFAIWRFFSIFLRGSPKLILFSTLKSYKNHPQTLFPGKWLRDS